MDCVGHHTVPHKFQFCLWPSGMLLQVVMFLRSSIGELFTLLLGAVLLHEELYGSKSSSHASLNDGDMF